MLTLNTKTWIYAICYELNVLELNCLLLCNGPPWWPPMPASVTSKMLVFLQIIQY